VPADHAAVEKLPAVNGSSGRLVIERPSDPAAERQWPGQVFTDASRDYAAAMPAFVAASNRPPAPVSASDLSAAQALKAHKRALRQEETHLRDARREVRQRRQLEDAAWRALKTAHQAQTAAATEPSAAEHTAQEDAWQVLQRQRHETVAQRAETDREWRQQRLDFRQRWSQLPIITAWIAILVITDNCTRQCLGLPLFVAGPKVTAELIVEALRVLLPSDLRFLISDRGVHFRAAAFQSFVRQEGFIHVLIARHRPQSNGIAERFVRSLKEWLRDKSWQDDQELAALLAQFRAEYDDRPHQGLAIPGLSPNEFANRIWLF
jgi:transposase InsO family protein